MICAPPPGKSRCKLPGCNWPACQHTAENAVPYGIKEPKRRKRLRRKALPPGPAHVMPPGIVAPNGEVCPWDLVQELCREGMRQ